MGSVGCIGETATNKNGDCFEKEAGGQWVSNERMAEGGQVKGLVASKLKSNTMARIWRRKGTDWRSGMELGRGAVCRAQGAVIR